LSVVSTIGAVAVLPETPLSLAIVLPWTHSYRARHDAKSSRATAASLTEVWSNAHATNTLFVSWTTSLVVRSSY